MKIEPIVSEKELNQVKNELVISKKDSFGFELQTNLMFVAKNNHSVVGVIELVPISRKGVLVRHLLSNDRNSAKKLLNEALMYAWEMDYCAAFSETNNPLFLDSGFKRIDTKDLDFPFHNGEILAYPLTYNGLSTFIKETHYQLN